MSDKSYTVDELADAERVSRAFVYKAWKEGNGPDYYMQGNRRRITEQQRQDWHKRLQAENGGAK